jgi:hypothetical protein
MSAVSPITAAVRADRYAATTFTVFRVSEPVKSAWNPKHPGQTTYILGPVKAGSVDEAVSQALANYSFSHKQQMIIREEGERGMLLHLYAIVRKPDAWVQHNHVPRREQRLGTRFLCVIDAGVLGA